MQRSARNKGSIKTPCGIECADAETSGSLPDRAGFPCEILISAFAIQFSGRVRQTFTARHRKWQRTRARIGRRKAYMTFPISPLFAPCFQLVLLLLRSIGRSVAAKMSISVWIDCQLHGARLGMLSVHFSTTSSRRMQTIEPRQQQQPAPQPQHRSSNHVDKRRREKGKCDESAVRIIQHTSVGPSDAVHVCTT